MNPVLSLDIGGTKLSAAVLSRSGDLLSKERAPTLAQEGPRCVIARLLDLAARVTRSAGVPVDAAGVSVGGPLDSVAGIVHQPPNLPGWDHVSLRALLSEGLGIPADRIAMENDANAGALAEHRFGAARGRSHLVFLTMSTGIGGGMILDGRLYRGAGLSAGEVGHQMIVPDGPVCGCGKRGCLEAVASGAGIASRLRERFDEMPARIKNACGSPDQLTARHLIDAARDGDPFAVMFLEETAALLARGIANLVFILNPEMLVLGTLAWHARDLLLVPLRAELRRLCWPVLTQSLEVVATQLGPRLEELSGLCAFLEAERLKGMPVDPPGCPSGSGSP